MSRRTGTFRILIGDTVFGPMSYDEGLSLVAAGRLSDSNQVSKDDGPWNPASEFFDLKPNASFTQPPPPPPEDSLSTQHDRWQYRKDGKFHGPFTTDDMMRFLEQGRIVAETLAWKPGLAGWVPFRDTDIWQPISIKKKHQLTLSCLWIYRCLLLTAIVAVFCPWIGASTSSSFGSYSTSIAGISLGWGILALVAAMCGGVSSFIDKNSIPAELRWLPVGIGVAVALFPLIARFSMITVTMSGNFGGLSSLASTGAQFGLWLTLLSGAAATVAAYLSFIKGVPDIVIGNFGGIARSGTVHATPEAKSSPSDSTIPTASLDQDSRRKLVLGFLIIVGLAAGVYCVAAFTGVTGGGNTASMTKNEFRQAMKELSWSGINDMDGIQGMIPEDEFFAAFGQPVRTQTLGDFNFWYYQCEDGLIQVVKSAVFGQGLGNDQADTVYLHAVNDY